MLCPLTAGAFLHQRWFQQQECSDISFWKMSREVMVARWCGLNLFNARQLQIPKLWEFCGDGRQL